VVDNDSLSDSERARNATDDEVRSAIRGFVGGRGPAAILQLLSYACYDYAESLDLGWGAEAQEAVADWNNFGDRISRLATEAPFAVTKDFPPPLARG